MIFTLLRKTNLTTAAIMITLLMILVPLVAVVTTPQPAFALFENSKREACKGVNLSNDQTQESCEQNRADAEKTLNSTLATAINLFSLFIAIVAVITIMISGLRYITAGGDAGNITSAKNTLMYAVIGLIIAAFAQFIVKFVLQKTSE